MHTYIQLFRFLACMMIAAFSLALSACDDDESSNNTTADTISSDGTSGTSADTSGTSGTTSADTSGTSADTSGTSGDTSGIVSNTIVDIATGNPDFSTLAAALTAADLVTTLQGEGPFTVFAPTNAAFEKLPADALADLLKPENKDDLASILLYHVVSDDLDATEVTSSSLLPTVQGSKVKVTSEGGQARIGGALITTTDIKADNGVIHVIDTVIMPPGSIAEIVSADANFSTLLTAVGAADLAGPLGAASPKLTVFAPTNAAFDKVPADTLTALLEPANKAVLTKVLLFHAAAGEFDASQVGGLQSVETLSGFDATITTDGGAKIDGAVISATDIPASNGIIHVIDDVIMPPTLAEVASSNPDFSTLVAALAAADLVEAVSDPFSPLTVFAPTNAAFDALPAGTLDSLLLPENKAQLTSILLYHVVSGELDAAAVTASASLTTLEGNDLTITTAGGAKVNGASITTTDVPALNGVIHVIDAVLLPPTP
jgi:uncharacterized surface protein with fasciclin (FAS1) repeats